MTQQDEFGIMAYMKIMAEFSNHPILYPYVLSKGVDDNIHTFIYQPAKRLAEIYDELVSETILLDAKTIDKIKENSNSIWFGNDRKSDVRNKFPRTDIALSDKDSYIQICKYLSLPITESINIDSIAELAGHMEIRLGKVVPERNKSKISANKMENCKIKIFISHCSDDKTLVESLIDLLRNAFNLDSEDIRCTSVDGYKLPIGADLNETIRKEVSCTKIFIAVITESALASPYTMFECGARWGTAKPFYPIVCSIYGAKLLQGPLQVINAAIASNEGDIHNFLESISNNSGFKLQKVTSYNRNIKNLIDVINNKGQNKNDDELEKKIEEYMQKHTFSVNDIDRLFDEAKKGN